MAKDINVRLRPVHVSVLSSERRSYRSCTSNPLDLRLVTSLDFRTLPYIAVKLPEVHEGFSSEENLGISS